MSYITLRGHYCDIVLNVHTPPEDKSNDTKDGLYEELQHIQSILEVSQENSLRIFQCKSTERKYF